MVPEALPLPVLEFVGLISCELVLRATLRAEKVKAKDTRCVPHRAYGTNWLQDSAYSEGVYRLAGSSSCLMYKDK